MSKDLKADNGANVTDQKGSMRDVSCGGNFAYSDDLHLKIVMSYCS